MPVVAKLVKLELIETRYIEYAEPVITKYYCQPLAKAYNPDDIVPVSITPEREDYFLIELKFANGSIEKLWVYVPPQKTAGDIGNIIAAYIGLNEKYFINQIKDLRYERNKYRALYRNSQQSFWNKLLAWLKK